MSDTVCSGCDGSGFYTPQFSPTALVNCLVCNADFSKADWAGIDDEDDEDMDDDDDG